MQKNNYLAIALLLCTTIFHFCYSSQNFEYNFPTISNKPTISSFRETNKIRIANNAYPINLVRSDEDIPKHIVTLDKGLSTNIPVIKLANLKQTKDGKHYIDSLHLEPANQSLYYYFYQRLARANSFSQEQKFIPTVIKIEENTIKNEGHLTIANENDVSKNLVNNVVFKGSSYYIPYEQGAIVYSENTLTNLHEHIPTIKTMIEENQEKFVPLLLPEENPPFKYLLRNNK